MPGGFFYLVERSAEGSKKLSDPMPMDDFVAFVNAREPAKPRKVSKLDRAMEEQIGRSGKRTDESARRRRRMNASPPSLSIRAALARRNIEIPAMPHHMNVR